MSLPEREVTNLTWRTSRSRAVQHPFDRSRANERFDYYCCFKRGPINRAVSRCPYRKIHSSFFSGTYRQQVLTVTMPLVTTL